MSHDEPRTLDGLHNLLDLMHADLHRLIDGQKMILDGQKLAATERHQLMSLASEIKGQIAALQSKVDAEQNINTAIVAYVDGIKAQNVQLQAKLAEALQNSATPEELQEISAGFKQLNDSIDAHSAADAAIANTPVAGTPAADGSSGNAPA